MRFASTLLALLASIVSSLFLLHGIAAPAAPTVIQAGFYRQEQQASFIYRFAQPQASILVYDVSELHVVHIRVRSPAPLPPRILTFAQQGRPLASLEIGASSRSIHVLMPKPEQSGIGSLLELTTPASSAPGDQRALGLMYEQVTAQSLQELPIFMRLRWVLLLATLLVMGLAIRHAQRILSQAGRMHLAAALLLGAILFAYFAPTIVTGRVLSSADMIFTTPVFRQYAPEGFSRASNPILSDQPYQFTPWRLIAWQALREGHLPLWDSHSLAGRPFLATQQAAFFYPINLLLSLLPFKDTFLWSAFVRLWLAGFGTWLLARHYQLVFVSSLLAALSYMLCGFLIVWLNHPHTNVAICLPWLILLADRLVHAKQNQQRIRDMVYLALVTAFQFMGGHIQTSLDMLVALTLYLLLRWWHMPHPRPELLRCLLPIVAGLVLGSMLAAVHLLPFLEWLPHSEVLLDRSSRPFSWLRPGIFSESLSLVLLFYPNLYNNPTWSFPGYYNPNTASNYNESTWYIGIIGLVCAVVAIVVLIRREALARIWLIICVFALGRAFQWPGFDWLNQLPGFALAVPARNRLIAQLALCMLAGFGAQALWHYRGGLYQKAYHVALLSFGGVIGLGLAITIWGAEWLAGWSKLTPLHLQISNTGMYLPGYIAVAGMALLLLQRIACIKKIVGPGLVLLAGVDLLLWGQSYNPSIAPAYFYPTTAALRRIQSDPDLFRMSAPHTDILPDSHTLYGLSDIRGLDFRTKWYTRYINLIPGRGGSLYYTGFTNLNQPLARALNLKYILSEIDDPYAADLSLHEPGLIDGIYIWQIQKPIPRALLTQQLIIASSDDDAIRRLRQNPGIASTAVIVLAEEQAPILDATSQATHSKLTLMSYAPETASWQVVSDQAAYLLIQDSYYPGWKASIDGSATPIYRANIAFRAVYVPAGKHTITLYYQPWWLTIGLGLSISTFLFLGWLVIAGSKYLRM